MNLQPVSDAKYCHNPVIPIQFFTQTLDMRIQRSGLTTVFFLPDCFVQSGTAQSHIFVPNQLHQKIKFFHSQIDLMPIFKYLAGYRIKRHIIYRNLILYPARYLKMGIRSI